VARIRSVGPVTTVTEGGAVEDPLTGASWTQQATELNSFQVGEVSFTRPSALKCTEAPGPFARALIFLDGNRIGESSSTETVGTETRAMSYSFLPSGNEPWLPEPGKATSHTLTARVEDFCAGHVATPPFHLTVNSISIDVIGVP
jgi:hypothetical protein